MHQREWENRRPSAHVNELALDTYHEWVYLEKLRCRNDCAVCVCLPGQTADVQRALKRNRHWWYWYMCATKIVGLTNWLFFWRYIPKCIFRLVELPVGIFVNRRRGRERDIAIILMNFVIPQNAATSWSRLSRNASHPIETEGDFQTLFWLIKHYFYHCFGPHSVEWAPRTRK